MWVRYSTLVLLYLAFEIFSLCGCENKKPLQGDSPHLIQSEINQILNFKMQKEDKGRKLKISPDFSNITSRTNFDFIIQQCDEELSFFIQEKPFPEKIPAPQWRKLPCGSKKISYTLQKKTDGDHFLSFFLKDKTSLSFIYPEIFKITLDLTPPFVEFKDIPPSLFSGDLFELQWEVSEAHSSSEYKLQVEYSLDQGESWQMLNQIILKTGSIERQRFKSAWSVPQVESAVGLFRIKWEDLVHNEVIRESKTFMILKKKQVASNPRAPSQNHLECPVNYVLVTAHPEVGTSHDFCVAKFEMKAQSLDGIVEKNGCGKNPKKCDFENRLDIKTHVPVSSPEGTPWVQISQGEALEICQNIGPGFDLISNAQWMSVARLIEQEAKNWRLGQARETEINIGHCNQKIPGHFFSNNALSVQDVEDPWSGVEHGNPKDYEIWTQKRTHTLSAKEEIWDFGGNVWEFVKDYFYVTAASNSGLQCFEKKTCWTDYANDPIFTTDPRAETLRKQFSPLSHSLSYVQVGGKFFPQSPTNFSSQEDQVMTRGGKWDGGQFGGIYAAWLFGLTKKSTSSEIGFRCVYATETNGF